MSAKVANKSVNKDAVREKPEVDGYGKGIRTVDEDAVREKARSESVLNSTELRMNCWNMVHG